MKQYSLISFLLLTVSISFANSSFEYDTLKKTDTLKITTELYDEYKIHEIDSICNYHDYILKKMPAPVFVRPKGIYIDRGEDYSYIKYDSINSFISKHGYKTKIGNDTLGNIIREIYFIPDFEYGRVIYSNYLTGEVLMIITTAFNTFDFEIAYLSNNKIIRKSYFSQYESETPNDELRTQVNSYYSKGNLMGAYIICKCEISLIEIRGNRYSLDFNDCSAITFEGKVNEKKITLQSLKKEDKKWIKQN